MVRKHRNQKVKKVSAQATIMVKYSECRIPSFEFYGYSRRGVTGIREQSTADRERLSEKFMRDSYLANEYASLTDPPRIKASITISDMEKRNYPLIIRFIKWLKK